MHKKSISVTCSNLLHFKNNGYITNLILQLLGKHPINYFEWLQLESQKSVFLFIIINNLNPNFLYGDKLIIPQNHTTLGFWHN